MTENRTRKVRVVSPARIHCGLLNESGLYHRVDGGLGFALTNPRWVLELSVDDSQFVSGVDDPELELVATQAITEFSTRFALPPIRVVASECIPCHAGLGAKTSMLMALGCGISKLFDLGLSAHQVATMVRRGGTSGIGVHAREAGGFIWDAGHRYPPHKASMEPSSASGAPPAQCLLSLHPNWLKVVHFRFSDRGLHGLAEKRFFEVNCPVDPQETTALLALVAGSFLPSLIEADDAGVQAAVAAMQELGLKRLEWRTQDRETLAFRDFWRSQTRSAALGLTSLGPTLYCLTKDPTSVMEAVRSYGKAPLSIAVSDLFDPSTAG